MVGDCFFFFLRLKENSFHVKQLFSFRSGHAHKSIFDLRVGGRICSIVFGENAFSGNKGAAYFRKIYPTLIYKSI